MHVPQVIKDVSVTYFYERLQNHEIKFDLATSHVKYRTFSWDCSV